MLIDARCSLFGSEPWFDGLERNEKKEEERAGVEDDIDAVGEWLVDGRDIPEDPLPLVVVVPEQDGVVVGYSADDLRARSIVQPPWV